MEEQTTTKQVITKNKTVISLQAEGVLFFVVSFNRCEKTYGILYVQVKEVQSPAHKIAKMN